MKTRGSLIAAVLCFLIGSGLFWVTRADLAKSVPLMCLISFWWLMSFLFGLHADTTDNLVVIAQNIPILKSLVASRTQNATPQQPPEEPHG